jgi:hypothetical protein
MLNQWFYSHPTWEVAGLICAVLLILALGGLRIFHRLVDWHVREEDTAMVGLSYALCGSVYGVLLAFLAVGTYESMERAARIASEEADSVGDLAFDSAGLPASLAVRVRADVGRYLDIVIHKEWPSQQHYRMEAANYKEGGAQVRRISMDLTGFEPSSAGQATVKAEMTRVIGELSEARRARLLAATSHTPSAVWQMLIFGLGVVVVYVFLFGPHNYWIHGWVTTLTVLSIGLAFALVISLDYPFRGELSVDSEAFVRVREVAERAFPAGALAGDFDRPQILSSVAMRRGRRNCGAPPKFRPHCLPAP